MAFFYP